MFVLVRLLPGITLALVAGGLLRIRLLAVLLLRGGLVGILLLRRLAVLRSCWLLHADAILRAAVRQVRVGGGAGHGRLLLGIAGILPAAILGLAGGHLVAVRLDGSRSGLLPVRISPTGRARRALARLV
ncbi:hypothetical protein, partial [Arthrobacter sp. Leaf141]|uniref:hypothetical protein n=1 Tax=Arthrobacter sp. Leaf141 TaxID=1736273 RepID=UPI0019106E38